MHDEPDTRSQPERMLAGDLYFADAPRGQVLHCNIGDGAPLNR
jgi:hypothetical protein